MKLKKVSIYGFKDGKKSAILSFKDNRISVIYGRNGNGKTTFLDIIFAIFNKNSKHLNKENVDEILIEYQDDNNNVKEVKITSLYENNEITYDWSEFDKSTLKDFNILYITPQRALNNFRNYLTVEQLSYFFKTKGNYSLNSNSSYIEFDEFINFINGKSFFNETLNNNNIFINNLQISDLENLIVDNILSYKNKTLTSDSDTYLNLMQIAMTYLSDIENNTEKQFVQNSVINDPKRKFTTEERDLINHLFNNKAQVFFSLEKFDLKGLTSYSFVKKARNILKPHLVQSKKLTYLKAFKMYTNKELYCCEQDKTIKVKFNDNEHSIAELSHGEKQLVTMLSLVEILGYNKNLIIIDEPCIALDTDWQEDILSTFIEISDSQILIATQSPYLTINHIENQVKIKSGYNV